MAHHRPETLTGAPLGRESAYPEHYDAGLLYPIERAANRAPLGIEEGALPFDGEDEWHAFELSWLNARGKPIVAVARFRLPASSPRLIESKSWKLYLNSFNQSRFASTDEVTQLLERDLAEAAGAAVGVEVFGVDDPALTPRSLPGECIDDLDIEIADYTPSAAHLTVGEEIVEETLHSHLLKSNCPVTGQPDWGSVMIRYRGPKLDREGLLRYLVGYRQHQDFHEHCVEHIFTDLMARARPERLLVLARYVRRGGLDISPWRATPGERPPEPLRLARQ
ncbi:NADPH-dependent 7-cyano-7-deazaguanine reductase QueF [Halomonas elongata]|uniref:NADPH-dependent 7-cyano-7-deazaguanine reductase n=1 Tax=Halomonas elongata (strain ATCC 33173 / DSM 2581 / NBRC 15536 / NCIMB 2198 / 1H9) TaxID=768066 RepID=E1V9R8_HALED|nr:NADPH-dependent 7-cyano-7-deazaguanine reductase QueF [Halomonas elongata]WBF19145.1 NADPH-dependent 7-cyano-7-deazaguanine reductase QueF [Halomonas elongata]WPU48004.1 NADPH-dependent 7-cyano-7-deazaguanine reductase QueF [Halomonas elongata DSM 2581]CBV41902.1 7-cyano-7-deazaguanine reductase [Halomonas elongata DSM 2581]